LARKKVPTEVARPAPFTPEQVAALITGEADHAAVGKVLAAHRQPRIPVPARRSTSKATAAAPIPISPAELRELTTGQTPDRVAGLLDTTASARRHSSGGKRKVAARPKHRPR
jgi:hypothetical protein